MRTTYWPEAATLANACLHYVFDLWARQWRRRQAHGDVIIGRAGAQAALRRGSGSGRGVRGSPWGRRGDVVSPISSNVYLHRLDTSHGLDLVNETGTPAMRHVRMPEHLEGRP
jgi:hypothetical protein